MPSTDGDALASWGGGPDLSAWEALMWRTDGDHRTRSTGVMIELLDTEPDWDRLVAAHDRFTQRVPRLRERVVEPPLPLVPPAWSPDPLFDLEYHLQRVRLPGDGSMAELHVLAAQFAARPLDPERPAWEALLVLGVTGGQAAYLFKPHHSLSDGIGLLQLLDLAHGHSREPGPADDRPLPGPRRKESPEGLLVNRLAARLVNAPTSAVREALSVAGRFAGDPVGTTTDAVKFAMSLRRVLMPPDTPHSPALTGSGSGYRLDTFDVPFADRCHEPCTGELVGAHWVGVGAKADRDRHRHGIHGEGKLFVVAPNPAEHAGQECVVDRTTGGLPGGFQVVERNVERVQPITGPTPGQRGGVRRVGWHQYAPQRHREFDGVGRRSYWITGEAAGGGERFAHSVYRSADGPGGEPVH